MIRTTTHLVKVLDDDTLDIRILNPSISEATLIFEDNGNTIPISLTRKLWEQVRATIDSVFQNEDIKEMEIDTLGEHINRELGEMEEER